MAQPLLAVEFCRARYPSQTNYDIRHNRLSLTTDYFCVIMRSGFCAMTTVATWTHSNSGIRPRIYSVRRLLRVGFPLLTTYHSPLTVLIAGPPIRNQPNPCALNTNCISNRQKKGTFLKPANHNLKPVTSLPNPCPPVFWRGNNNLKPTRCSSNRNCKELKTDVTP